MFGYLVNKIIGFITTLFLVSIVCFFMIKLSPGDKADALLQLQGISLNPESTSDYFKEYNALSNRLGLDKPWFYVTFASSNIVTSFPDGWNYLQENLAENLMNNKVKSRIALAYVRQLIKVESICNVRNNNDCLREISFLYFQTDPLKINERIGSLEKTTSHEDSDLASNIVLLKSTSSELSKKVRFYLPRISMHGLNNQYHNWLLKILKLDFGISVVDGLPVTAKVWQALKWTLLITMMAYFLTLIIGLPTGIFSAVKDGSRSVRIIEITMNALYAVPVFWMATILIIFFTTAEFGTWTNIFPSPSFRVTEDQRILSYVIRNFQLMILPVICLTLSALPIIVRLTKRSVKSEAVNPYIVALKAKGLSDNYIYRKHVVPNALIPIVTLISNTLPVALAGSLIVEIIFNIPGMGRLMFGSIQRFDWDVCFAILLLISIVTSIVLLVADVIYARINPKIRFS